MFAQLHHTKSSVGILVDDWDQPGRPIPQSDARSSVKAIAVSELTVACLDCCDAHSTSDKGPLRPIDDVCAMSVSPLNSGHIAVSQQTTFRPTRRHRTLGLK